MTETLNVLLVEDNDGDARYLEKQLERSTEYAFAVKRVGWLKNALQAVGMADFDVVLLDLSLPDCQGIDTVVEVMQAAPTLPIIVTTGTNDMQTAIKCVRYGVQDYVLKGHVDARSLELTVVTSVERKRVDLVGKQLIHSSLASYDDASTSDAATVQLLRNGSLQIVHALHEWEIYFAKNAPEHLPQLQAIADRFNLKVVLQQFHEVLQLDPQNDVATPPRGLRRPRAISTQAQKAVERIVTKRSSQRSKRPDTERLPSDPPEAEAVLLDVMTRRGNG